MDRVQGLRAQIEMWHEQAQHGQLSYRELEKRIRQQSQEIEEDAASFSPDEYKALRSLLTLTDSAGQKWTLALSGKWRGRTTEGKTFDGEPNLEDPSVMPPHPHPSPPPLAVSSKPSAWLWLVGGIVGVLLLVGGSAVILGGSLVPSPSTPTETVAPSPTHSPIITVAVATTVETPPTSSPVPPTVAPSTTPTQIPPTPIPTPPTAEPTVPPTLSPTTELTTEPTEIATAEPSATPSPEISLASTDTPVVTLDQPSGTLVYAVFDETTKTYNIFMRTWPDFHQVDFIPQAGQPAVSSDGKFLAYRSWDGGRQGIVKRDIVARTEIGFINMAEAIRPAWSPNSKLAYVANNSKDQKWHIYFDSGQVVPLDGSQEGLAWLTEERLVFHGCMTNLGCGLWTANTDGSNPQRLTDQGHDFNPAPSPDGQQIAFMSDRAGNWDIYVVAANTSPPASPILLTSPTTDDILPAWSPDGRWIAFVSNQNGKWTMQVIPATGGTAQYLFDLEGSPDGFIVSGPPGQAGRLQERIGWLQ